MRGRFGLILAGGLVLAICAGFHPQHMHKMSVTALPPVVIKTVPVAGTTGVDPGTKEIRVTFSKDMMDQSWSFVQMSKETFPMKPCCTVNWPLN